MGKSDEEVQSLLQILRALNFVCTELDLSPIQRERYIRECNKWTIQVEEKQSGEHLTLEFFVGLHRGLRYKFLDGNHLLRFDFSRQFGQVHCFGYKRSTNVRECLDEVRSVCARETGLVPILESVLRGMFVLTCQRLLHQRLTMENIRIMGDHTAKIGDLELIVPEREVRMTEMAPVAHLPPELLAVWPVHERNLVKVQMWILGSQVLELLIGKHVSGDAFNQHDPMVKLTRRCALKNIRRNVRYLPYVLAASNLSYKMQDFLANVLTVNPNQRMNVLQAMMYFNESKDDISTISGEDSCCTNMQKTTV